MRKLILTALTALSIYLVITMYRTGIKIESRLPINVDIYSYNEMLKQGDVLNKKLDELEELNTVEIAAANEKVENERDGFEAKKAEYEELEASASEEEIAEANKKQEYLLDYLWIVIGNYANDNNVKFKMQTDDVNLRINFDITGSYVSIINFVYDLQNDENLRFNLNGIKLASSTSADTTKANFSVDGITVKTSNQIEEM